MMQRKFWLASNSPRRKEIFAWMDWDWESTPANIDESLRNGESARDYLVRIATEKANSPIPSIQPKDIIVAADTIVVLDGRILGKPVDKTDAFQMLISLRGRDHAVMTAVAIRTGDKSFSRYEICNSPVLMRDYTDTEITRYVESGDPMDKAGAYAIQNATFHPVNDFNGCYASVMGMPLCHLERMFINSEIQGVKGMAETCQNQLKYTCPITARVLAGEEIG